MKTLSLGRILVWSLIAILPSLKEQAKASSDPSSLTLTNLRCEYLVDPLGIGESNPRLSWELEPPAGKASLRGQKQTAFQVQVASTQELLAKDKADLWDSGQVTSDHNIHPGVSLVPRSPPATSCHPSGMPTLPLLPAHRGRNTAIRPATRPGARCASHHGDACANRAMPNKTSISSCMIFIDSGAGAPQLTGRTTGIRR